MKKNRKLTIEELNLEASNTKKELQSYVKNQLINLKKIEGYLENEFENDLENLKQTFFNDIEVSNDFLMMQNALEVHSNRDFILHNVLYSVVRSVLIGAKNIEIQNKQQSKTTLESILDKVMISSQAADEAGISRQFMSQYCTYDISKDVPLEERQDKLPSIPLSGGRVKLILREDFEKWNSKRKKEKNAKLNS
jgi:hypothetical protein